MFLAKHSIGAVNDQKMHA